MTRSDRPNHTRATSEQDARIAELWEAGTVTKVIAHDLGRSTNWVRERVRKMKLPRRVGVNNCYRLHVYLPYDIYGVIRADADAKQCSFSIALCAALKAATQRSTTHDTP